MKHYDIRNKLLKAKDKNGEDPIVYIACSPLRGPGKTFSAAAFLYEKCVSVGRKFGIIIRYKGRLGSIAEGVFGEMLDQKHPGVVFKEKRKGNGIYSEILSSERDFESEEEDGEEKIKTECVGYVIPLASYNDIKTISSVFRDVDYLLFDEFMPEHDDVYLSDELELFLSVYDSINRGGKGFGRNVKVIMLSNAIDIFNPYFKAFGISERIQPNTKFTRGKGVVFERADVEGLADYRNTTGIRSILVDSGAVDTVTDNSWMNDSKALIERPKDWGKGQYYCTLEVEGKQYGVRYYRKMNIYHISRTVDKTCSEVFSLVLNGSINYPLINTSIACISLINAMKRVRVRFADRECKQLFFDYLL